MGGHAPMSGLIAVLLVAAAPGGGGGGITAVTSPSRDVTLSFVRPGRIAEVLVAEGRPVKPAQVLVRQDDAAEQARLLRLKEQAEDTTQVRAARAQLDQSKLDLKKIEQAAKRGAATDLEIEHAALDVTIAELRLELAQFQHRQSRRTYEEFRLEVGRMRLLSPIGGTVEEVFIEAGESVDTLQKVVRVVSTDPLWIDVPVPLARARRLAVGGDARVAFDGAAPAAPNAKIIHVASVDDSASDTLRVRLEAANPSGRPAGEEVTVSFPEPKSAAAESKE